MRQKGGIDLQLKQKTVKILSSTLAKYIVSKMIVYFWVMSYPIGFT